MAGMSEQPRRRAVTFRKRAALHSAVEIVEIAVPDIAAIKALDRGDATPEQQHRAISWIVRRLAGIGEIAFAPGDPYATHFKDGRKFVGIVLANIISEPMDRLRAQFGLPAADPGRPEEPKD